MDLGADVVGDQANNPLAIARAHPGAGIRKAARQPVDPQPSIRIEHHLDNRGVLEPARDRRPKSRTQHARAAERNL